MRVTKIQNDQTQNYKTANQKVIYNQQSILSPQINIKVDVVYPTINPDSIFIPAIKWLKSFINRFLNH